MVSFSMLYTFFFFFLFCWFRPLRCNIEPFALCIVDWGSWILFFFATDYLFCITFQFIFLFEFGLNHMFCLGFIYRTIDDNHNGNKKTNKVSNKIRQYFSNTQTECIVMKFEFEYHSMMRRTKMIVIFVRMFLGNRHLCICTILYPTSKTLEGNKHCFRHVRWPVSFLMITH